MKHTEAHIEDRIKWKVGQYNFPTEKTYFIEGSSLVQSIEIPEQVGKAVLYSEASRDEYIIIGTRGAFVKYAGQDYVFSHSEIADVSDLEMKPNEDKADLRELQVTLSNGNVIPIKPEPYGSAFGIWSILKMLKRLFTSWKNC